MADDIPGGPARRARRSPLAHRTGAFEAASGPGVSIEEVPFVAQTLLRGDAAVAAFRDGCARILGFGLPTRPNTTWSDGQATAAWLGPDEWLLFGPEGSGEAVRGALTEALEGVHAAVVEVDAARTVIALSGPAAREVLESVCILDLHPRSFAPGGCAQTMIGPAQIILHLRNDGGVWWLFVRPSYADWLAAWLIDAITNLG